MVGARWSLPKGDPHSRTQKIESTQLYLWSRNFLRKYEYYVMFTAYWKSWASITNGLKLAAQVLSWWSLLPSLLGFEPTAGLFQ